MKKYFSKLNFSWEGIVKGIIYLLVFLMPMFFLPWTADALGFGKQTILVFLVFIACVICFLKTIISGRAGLNISWLHFPTGIFLLVYAAAAIFSFWKYESFWGWPGVSQEALLTIIGLVFLYFLINSVFGTKEFILSVKLLVFSFALALVFGIFQIFGKFLFSFDFSRNIAFNTIGSPGALAVLSAVFFPLIAFLLFDSKKAGKIFLSFVLAAMLIVLFLVDFALSWWLVIAGSVLLIVISTQKKELLEKRFVILPMVFLAISLVFIFFQVFQIERPIEVYLSSGESASIAKEAIKERPIFGSGPGTFAFNFSKHKSKAINETIFWDAKFTNASSGIVNLLANTGIIGFLSAIFLFGTALVFCLKLILEGFSLKAAKKEKTLKNSNDSLQAVQSGIAISLTVLIISAFFYYFSFALVFVFFFLLAGISIFSIKERKEITLKPSSLPSLALSFAFTIFFILVLGVFILHGQRVFAELNYYKAIKAWNENRFEQGIAYLENSVQISPIPDIYHRELAQAYIQKLETELGRQDIVPEEAPQRIEFLERLISFAVNAAAASTEANPLNTANWSVRGLVYQKLIGISEEAGRWALQAYDTAISLEPKNPYFPEQKANIFLQEYFIIPEEKMEEKEKAISDAEKELKKAIELKSDYIQARLLLSDIYMIQGKESSAIDELLEARTISPRNVEVLLKLGVIYYQKQDYSEAQNVFETALLIFPNYSDALYFLGIVYDKQGEKEKALERFEKVLTLNPGDEEVGRIISNLKQGKEALEGIVQDFDFDLPSDINFDVPFEAPIEQ